MILDFFELLVDFFGGLCGQLDTIVLYSYSGLDVSLFDFIFASIVVMMVISVFWKGAQG